MKIKKTFISILSLMLSLLFCVSTVGCNEQTENKVIGPEVISATDIDLVKNGMSDYVIVIPEDATNYEQYAAEELQLYIKQSTGANLNIVSDIGRTFNSQDKVISLGQTTIYQGSGVTVDYDEFKRDGFKIKRLDNTLVLCGGGGYGTLYAVYEFLYRQIDWEAYAPDEIYFRKTLNLKVLDFDFADKPAIESRHGGWRASATDSYFAAKRRTFAGVQYMMFNELVWYYYPHALFKIVNPVGFIEEHPDWYAASGAQPCYSSEGFRAQLIKGMKKIILEQPTIEYIPIGPEDEVNAICKCDACMKEINTYSYAGQVVRWVNSVVEEMEAWRVEQGIERTIYYPLLAYYETRQPPINRNAPNGVFEPIDESCVLHELAPVIYAPIEANFSRPLTDENYNKAGLNDLLGWKACSKSFMAYWYNSNFFKCFEWPDPVSSVVANYKLAVDMGAIHLEDDHSSGAYQGCAFQIMLGYIYAKVQWNPDVDVNMLIENFIKHYYKDACEEMLEYYYLMETTRTAVRDQRDKDKLTTDEGDWLSKGLLERAQYLIRKGMSEINANPNYTQKEKELYTQRLELELLTPLVYILDFFSSEYTSAIYLSIVDEVENLVNKYGLIITATYSYSETNEQKYEQWRKSKA